MKGKFITVEGCEGVGKSTLLQGLKAHFEEKGIEALFTREPGGTPAAERIRSLILDPAADITPTAELLLYAAARAQHTAELILPALERGVTVVCDRYSDSTLAYQGYARGLDLGLCRGLGKAAECGVTVDVTLFLDLPPEQGFLRKGGADTADRLEREDISFHRRVYEGFIDIARREPDRVAAIDASGTRQEVLNAAIAELTKRGVIYG